MLFLLALLFLAATTQPATHPATHPAMDSMTAFALGNYRWSHRPLLIFAPHEGERLTEQRRHLDAVKAGLAERDVLVVEIIGVDTGQATDARGDADPVSLVAEDVKSLRTQYDVLLGDFALILIGKDGGEKRRDDKPTALAALFEQIDAMPMRQDELRERRD